MWIAAAATFCVKVTLCQSTARISKKLSDVLIRLSFGNWLIWGLLMFLREIQCVCFPQSVLDLKLILPEISKLSGLVCCFHLLKETAAT